MEQRFFLRKVYFDPFQMVAVAQRLEKQHVKVEPYAQTVPNLTAATSNLFDLIQSRSLVLYPNAGMRLAVARAVIHEARAAGASTSSSRATRSISSLRCRWLHLLPCAARVRALIIRIGDSGSATATLPGCGRCGACRWSWVRDKEDPDARADR